MRLMVAVVCVGCVLFLAGSIWAKKLRENTRAPNFSLYDYKGHQLILQNMLDGGNWVVLVFYPKDSSFICTKQMCSIRDLMPHIPEGVKVVGVSNDNAESHREFAHKHHLPFPLLVDSNNQVRKLFGADTWGGRVTIIINPQGYIVKTCADMLSLEEHIGMIKDLMNQRR